MKYMWIALLLLSGCVSPQKENLLLFEALSAYAVQIETKTVQTTCDECKGTGKVKSGDGLNETQCPCGDNCQCKKPNEEPDENLPRTMIFVKARNCEACDQTSEKVFPVLKKRKYIIQTDMTKKGHIFIVDWHRSPIPKKYNVTGTPTYLLFKGDKLIGQHTGFLNSAGVIKFFEGKELTDKDTLNSD